LAAVNSTGKIDGSIEPGGFNCYDDFVGAGASPLIVQAGDLLGACVFDPVEDTNYDRRQLDVVGETEMDGESLLGMSTSGCTTDALPSNIPISQLSMVSSRRLHIYANISNNNCYFYRYNIIWLGYNPKKYFVSTRDSLFYAFVILLLFSACICFQSLRECKINNKAAVSIPAVTTEAEQSTEAFPTPPVGASPIASTTAHTRPTTNPSTMATLHPTTPLDIQGS
jgi:hypothetical protein